MKLGTTLVLVFTALITTTAKAAYMTGFEDPAFFSGAVNGQDGWTTATNDFTARVFNADDIGLILADRGLTPGTTVHGGSQALLVGGSGGSSATIRAIPDMDTESNVLLDVWARPLGAGNPALPLGNVFMTMEDANGDRAAAFRFGAAGGAQTIDYGTAVTGIWQPSGVQWDDQSWYHLVLDVDYANKTYDFFIDGVQVNAAPIPFYTAASDNFSQVRIFRGNNQSGMILDDLVVAVPEPAAAGILALIGCAALRRRRKA
jgi:hypothetical protein